MYFHLELFYGKLLQDKHHIEVNNILIIDIPGVQVAQDVLNKDLRPIIPKKTP